VSRGEVWWVERPDIGRRPHLVLTRDVAIPLLRSVIAVPATRTVRGIVTEVELGPEDGMPDSCALTLDNVRAIPKAFFIERICTLGPERMASVCRALAHATGCSATAT
jgi:mRNA interferase MazF